MATKVMIDQISVTQIETLMSKIEEKRSSPNEEDRRETAACINQLLGKLELALALGKEIEVEED